MALASKMLFSAVTNAERKTRDLLFQKLKSYFSEIVDAINGSPLCEKIYFAKAAEKIEHLFDTIGEENEFEDFINYIKRSVKSGEFVDAALDYYQYYPMECIETTEDNDVENIFLYRCLLQAVRIVALFHDVGHPPYSHIIESVLKDLYNTVESDTTTNWSQKKVNDFKKCLEAFLTKDPNKAFNCQRLFSEPSLIEAQPHERIGLSFLSYAIDDVIPIKIFDTATKPCDNTQSLSHILYYITVVEFVFAILTEKDVFFKSFHKIVDGILDSDRLDYIVRDSQNSGVDWGKIPYERIINSAKLFYLDKDNNGLVFEENEKPFVIAYPQKISDDIEDLILVRYKIFARINYHHRCMKTSMALQEAVRELAIDYLTTTDNKKSVNPDIHILWTSLNQKIGNKRIRAIQWNDSWLISALHKSLVSLYISDDDTTIQLKENLEEILLNRKKYYTLMKRGQDNCRFVEMVLKNAGITKELIDRLKVSEYKKYYSNPDNIVPMEKILLDPNSQALDSVGRLSEIFETLSLEALCRFISLDGNTLKNIIEESLKKCQKLTNAVVIINNGRAKNGLPQHKDVLDGIYLYKNNNCTLYNELFSLNNQIKSIEKNIPWLYVYFIPKTENLDISKLTEELFDILANSVGEALKKHFDELFNGKIPISK